MSLDHPELPSDPTAALQTVLKWIADSLSSEDVEAIAYINSLPGPADQRTALGVLRELERKGVFSHDNIDPLVRELANINRYDIIKRSWFEDFRRTCTERQNLRARQDSLTPTAKSSDDLEHEASSVSQSQEPTTTSEHESPFSLSSLPSDSATRDKLLQSLVADPHTRTRIVAMLREDLTVVRSSFYGTLGTDPSRSRTNTEPEIPLKSLPLEGRSVSLGSIGMSSVHPQPCTTTLQPSDDPCQSYKTFSQTSDDAPSQTSDSLLSFTTTSQASDDVPSQTSLDPSQSRIAIHQTPVDPAQSHDTILQTPDSTAFSLPSAEGQPHRESRESTSSQALGVGSPASQQSNSALQQQLSSSPLTSQQQGTLPEESQLRGTEEAAQENLQHGILKTTLSWKIKREEIWTRILKHTNKGFTRELKMKVDGYRSKPVKLAFKLRPNGIGHDTGNAMTLEVTVTVKQGCSELKEMAQLKMNIKTQIGEEFISVKELTQRLENFLVHDFLPHEVVQQTHGKYTEIEFEGSISFNIVDIPSGRGIEAWPSDTSIVEFARPQSLTTIQQKSDHPPQSCSTVFSPPSSKVQLEGDEPKETTPTIPQQEPFKTEWIDGSDVPSEELKLEKMVEKELRRERSSYNSLLGVEVVGEKEMVVTNEPMTFQWKDYGFKLHIPKNALPEGVSEYSVNIKASLAGQFELPEGYELVSAVYWVRTPGKFAKPVTIEAQHCANFSDSSQLRFVCTSCAQKSLPYKFKVIDGGSFSLGSNYGVLSTAHFSGKGIAKKETPGEHSCQYCAQVYFTVKHLQDHWYYCHFVVTKDLEMCLAVVRRKYQQEYDIAPPITFGGDHVALDIPDDGIQTDNGWEIRPLHKTCIKKDRVNNFSSESTWIPECVLLLKWKQKDKVPNPLEYKVKLLGTGDDDDFFLIVHHPGSQFRPLASPTQKDSTVKQQAESPQDGLTTDDILDVRKYLLNLGHTDIHCLGLTLGLNHLHLKKMREDSDTFREDMIAAWLQKEDRVSRRGLPTWETLVNALRDDQVKQHGVADKIATDKFTCASF